MEKIKPKKERRFLKAVGNIAKVLANELVMGIARKFIGKAIDKVGNKRQGLVIAFIILASTFAIAQYPTTGNKQRLGYQTTGDGLIYRGRATDTVAIKSSGLNNAYHIYDTINNVLYSYIKTKGGWVFSNGDTIIINNNFTQPVDSLFFNVNVPTNNVDTAKMRWDSDLATVVLGLNDNVPNELGFKNFWLVKNQTGSTITKGSLVYANGTVGASGRITVDKFIANGSIDAKYLLGITAHDLTDGEDGYVISFGKIRQINTDTFAAGAILYPSPTVAGVWTDVEPVAPNIDMPIGFCINSSENNGTIAIRVASGYKLNELHDVSISSPVEKSSLYYSGGLWRDTTPTLLVSDTASMLTNYLRTGVAASTYLTQSNAASTYLPLTGGTLTGGLTGTTGRFGTIGGNTAWESGNFKIQPYNNYPTENFGIVFNSLSATETMDFYWSGYSEQPRRAFRFIDGSTDSEKMRIEPFTGNVGINQTVPSYKLDVNGTLGVTGTTTLNESLTVNKAGVPLIINSTNSNLNKISLQDNTTVRSYLGAGSTKLFTVANSSVDEKLSVSNDGNTVISGSINVNSSAVFNEGSFDSDFRVESDGNANMVFVDASTDRVGIGTNAPTRTLEVNGTVGVSSNVTANSFIKSGGSFTQFLKADGTVDGNDYLTTSSAGSTYYPKTGGTISGAVTLSTTTATPTSLLGKDGSNVVGNVRLTPPLSLAGDSLNLGTVPITKGGTGAESASVARTTLGVGYVFLSTTTGGTVLLSSNRAYLVITGTGSTTTIDLSTATSGRQYMIKNLSNASVVSDASNIIPLNGGAAGTAILSAGNVTPQWVTLVADGTNWHVMQRN